MFEYVRISLLQKMKKNLFYKAFPAALTAKGKERHCQSLELLLQHLCSLVLESVEQLTCSITGIQGRLLQLRLPCEVRPDSSKAERSAVTGNLLLTMPKEDVSNNASNPAFTRYT